jgi:hypothetical protein
LGDTPEREIRSVPMESVGGVKKKSKSKESKDVIYQKGEGKDSPI